MKPARKVYTESMIRKVIQHHFEVEPTVSEAIACDCGWFTTTVSPNVRGIYLKEFEDHIVDQLHKLWHETVGSRSSRPTDCGCPQRSCEHGELNPTCRNKYARELTSVR